MSGVPLIESRLVKETQPWLFDKYVNGSNEVRRTNRHWSGLWSDLVLEKTLMGSFKSRGGLTSGHGMT